VESGGAALLTEAAFQNRSWAAFRKPSWNGHEIGLKSAPERPPRSLTACELAETDRTGDLWNLVRTWHGYITSWHMRAGYGAWHDSRDEAKFKGDADLQLMRGAELEVDMGPYERRGPLVGFVPEGYELAVASMDRAGFEAAAHFIESSHGLFFGGTTRNAELFLRRAIALSPGMAEAHLRLGRLLYRLDRTKEAQAELERAVIEARKSEGRFTRYVANLVLGQLHERAGRALDAEVAYREAVSVGLAGYSAPIALGTLLVATGRLEEGWRTIRSVFDDGVAVAPGAVDPWLGYRAFHYWQLADLTAVLRALVRREPRTAAGGSGLAPTAPTVPGGPPAVPGQAAGSGPRPATTSQGAKFRAIVDGVRVDVRVVGEDGHPIQGLTADDFIVLDNGAAQRATLVPTPARLAVALVIDTSSSAASTSPIVSTPPTSSWSCSTRGCRVRGHISDRLAAVAGPRAPRGARMLTFQESGGRGQQCTTRWSRAPRSWPRRMGSRSWWC
jgi:hypothetical protein